MSIEISNESGHAVDEAGLLGAARHALDEMGVNPLAELSLLLVDAEYMAELNHRWMDKTGPTDVLAFPMDELDADRGPGADDEGPEPTLLGDVVLCPAVAARQARAAGHPVEDELQLLTVHGILHLLGYDHAEPAEEKEMFGLQNKLLAGWREQLGDVSASPPDGCSGGRAAGAESSAVDAVNPTSWVDPVDPPGVPRGGLSAPEGGAAPDSGGGAESGH